MSHTERQSLKAQLKAKGIAIPIDTTTPDLAEMLRAARTATKVKSRAN